MQLDQPFGQRQTKAKPSLASVQGGIRLAERLEQARDHIGRHAHPGVYNLNDRSLLRRIGANRDARFSAAAGELGRVLQQVTNDLRQPIPVGIIHAQRDKIPQAGPSALHFDLFTPYWLTTIENLPDADDSLVRMRVGILDLFNHLTRAKPDQISGRVFQTEALAKCRIGELDPPVVSHQQDTGVHAGKDRVEALQRGSLHTLGRKGRIQLLLKLSHASKQFVVGRL